MTTKIDNPNTFPRYGVSATTKPLRIRNTKVMTKTMGNTDANAAKKNVKDIVVFGDGDLFQLLSKASSEKEGWMKSTKAMETPTGCFVQVTTQQRNPDGSYVVAEALAFAPDLCIRTIGGVKKLR